MSTLFSSTTNLEEEETVDAQGNDGNASISEQVKRPNPWMMMMMMINFINTPCVKKRYTELCIHLYLFTTAATAVVRSVT